MVFSHSHREDDSVDSVFGFGFCGSVCPLFVSLIVVEYGDVDLLTIE